MAGLNLSQMVDCRNIVGEDDEDTDKLNAYHRETEKFISGFSWSQPIEKCYFAWGVGGIMGVFLFKFVKPIGNTDEYLWVVVGDLPSVYLVTDEIKTVDSVLENYIHLMRDWCKAVLAGGGARLKKVYPVASAPTRENATALGDRLKFIEQEILK